MPRTRRHASTAVLEAQANLADALVSARVDYQISQIDLAYATGLTLGATRVEVGEQFATPSLGK